MLNPSLDHNMAFQNHFLLLFFPLRMKLSFLWRLLVLTYPLLIFHWSPQIKCKVQVMQTFHCPFTLNPYSLSLQPPHYCSAVLTNITAPCPCFSLSTSLSCTYRHAACEMALPKKYVEAQFPIGIFNNWLFWHYWENVLIGSQRWTKVPISRSLQS